MQRLRATRATTPSRGFITRAASALMFIGATALAIALPGDAAERNGITPSFNEWRESGSPAPSEGHWLDADIGTFRITRGEGLHDRVLRAWQKRVHQEPERAAREIHSMLIGGAEGREKLRQMVLNAAEGKEMMTSLDLDVWWESYSRNYLLDLADSGVEEILTYGEERMRERLGFVRNVNLEYRTPLGGAHRIRRAFLCRPPAGGRGRCYRLANARLPQRGRRNRREHRLNLPPSARPPIRTRGNADVAGRERFPGL